jgi:hypothetical protein
LGKILGGTRGTGAVAGFFQGVWGVISIPSLGKGVGGYPDPVTRKQTCRLQNCEKGRKGQCFSSGTNGLLGNLQLPLLEFICRG